MEVGGKVKRGKVQADTIITFLLSLGAIFIGITFVLIPITAEPYTFGYYLFRALGAFALIGGSICATDYWHRIKRELYPTD